METRCAGAEHMVLGFHQVGERGVLGLGQIYKGSRNKHLTVGDPVEGKRSYHSVFYSDFISELKGRSLCHFFMCFSKVL